MTDDILQPRRGKKPGGNTPRETGGMDVPRRGKVDWGRPQTEGGGGSFEPDNTYTPAPKKKPADYAQEALDNAGSQNDQGGEPPDNTYTTAPKRRPSDNADNTYTDVPARKPSDYGLAPKPVGMGDVQIQSNPQSTNEQGIAGAKYLDAPQKPVGMGDVQIQSNPPPLQGQNPTPPTQQSPPTPSQPTAGPAQTGPATAPPAPPVQPAPLPPPATSPPATPQTLPTSPAAPVPGSQQDWLTQALQGVQNSYDVNKAMQSPQFLAYQAALDQQSKQAREALGRQLAAYGVLGEGSTPATQRFGQITLDANQQLMTQALPQAMEALQRSAQTQFNTALESQKYLSDQERVNAEMTGQWRGAPTYQAKMAEQAAAAAAANADADRSIKWYEAETSRMLAGAQANYYNDRGLAAIANSNGKAATAKKGTDEEATYVKESTDMYDITPDAARVSYAVGQWVQQSAAEALSTDQEYQSLLKQEPPAKDHQTHQQWLSEVTDMRTRKVSQISGVAALGKLNDVWKSNPFDQKDMDYQLIITLGMLNQPLPPELQQKYHATNARDALVEFRNRFPSHKQSSTQPDYGAAPPPDTENPG